MSEHPDDQKLRTGPVYHWLGLGLSPPDGLHGYNRKRLTMRHTEETVRDGGRYMGQALARAYGRHREQRLLHLLRPQPLSDSLWRQVYALIVQGGPIWRWDLIRSLALLSGERVAAQAEAVRLFQSWDRNMRRLEVPTSVGETTAGPMRS